MSTKTARQTDPNIFLKAAVYDIETMNFAAGGKQKHLVCSCIMPLSAVPAPVYNGNGKFQHLKLNDEKQMTTIKIPFKVTFQMSVNNANAQFMVDAYEAMFRPTI